MSFIIGLAWPESMNREGWIDCRSVFNWHQGLVLNELQPPPPTPVVIHMTLKWALKEPSPVWSLIIVLWRIIYWSLKGQKDYPMLSSIIIFFFSTCFLNTDQYSLSITQQKSIISYYFWLILIFNQSLIIISNTLILTNIRNKGKPYFEAKTHCNHFFYEKKLSGEMEMGE